MKIVTLTAENIKKLVAIEIAPDGNLVQITGKNGQGKTSVLDSIWWALAGTSHIQAQPIRKGEKSARIKLDLGELKVERRFTAAGGSTLAVENADGARFPSPQKMLDALLGALSFDPLAFARMEPRRQFDELRRVASLDVDLDKLDGLNRSDYAKRTDLNRDAKAKRAQAEAITVPAGLPEKPADESAIVDAIQQAGEHNAQIEHRKARREQAERDARDKKAEAKRLGERAEALRTEAAALDKQAKAADSDAMVIEKKIDDAPPLPEPIDATKLRADLDAAKALNRQIGARARRAEIEAEAGALEKQSADLTASMDAREKAKTDAIAKAKMPVPGLGFGAGVVTYNEVPFDQASSAEQLRVSLSIAMAANPKLRVIRIQDGSLLDDDSLAQIASMAREKDYQVWIERVDMSGKIGFVIEDGQVKAAAPQEAAE